MAHIYAIDGLRPVVDPSAFVHPAAVLIGDVIVGPGCQPARRLRPAGSGGGREPPGQLRDARVPYKDCVVEANGHVGHGAILHGCRVGRDALIGMSAVIMDGAVIGRAASSPRSLS